MDNLTEMWSTRLPQLFLFVFSGGNTREGMTSSGPVLCLCLVHSSEYTMVLSLPLIHCGDVKLTLALLIMLTLLIMLGGLCVLLGTSSCTLSL